MVESSNQMSNKNSAKPDQSILDNLRLRFEEMHKAPLVTELEEECAVSKPSSTLICSICSNVVWNPTICQNCESHFCMKCVDSWTARSNSCPTCRKQPFVKGKVSKFAKNTLSEISFKCKKCASIFKYDKAEDHFS